MVCDWDLVAFDLDQTLWDHFDVSVTTPPFTRVGEGAVRDSRGVVIRLRSGVKQLLTCLRNRGVVLAVVSWNLRDKAEAVLKALGVKSFFHHLVIEYHPRKEEMFARLLREAGVRRGGKVAFVDNDALMIDRVCGRFPWVRCIHYGVDVRGFEELYPLLCCGNI